MSMDQRPSEPAKQVKQQKIPKVSPELAYGSTIMNPDPIDRDLRWLAAELRTGRAPEVVLDPGDATRYHFVIAPLFNPSTARIDRMVVSRLEAWNQKLLEARMVERPEMNHDFHRACKSLGRDQEWTTQVMLWWLRRVWAEIDAHPVKSAGPPDENAPDGYRPPADHALLDGARVRR